MEYRIMVKGKGIAQKIIGESLFDCIDTAYRNFKGQRVELIWVRSIGYIDGDELTVEHEYLDRGSVKEIVSFGQVPKDEDD